jgi:hypothetical protein
MSADLRTFSAIANAEREAQEKIQLQQVVRGLRFPPEYVNFCSERLIGRQPANSGRSHARLDLLVTGHQVPATSSGC